MFQRGRSPVHARARVNCSMTSWQTAELTIYGEWQMWSKEEVEGKVFNTFEFVETVLVEYSKNLYGMCLHPKKTIEKLNKSEVVSSLLFFVMNVFLAAMIQSFGNLQKFINKVLKLLVLTAKPSFDDAFMSMLGLFVGTLVFLPLLKLVIIYISKVRVGYKEITIAVARASFLFIPISVLNNVISSFFLSHFIKKLAPNSTLLVSLFGVWVAEGVLYWWWALIVLIGLKGATTEEIKIGRSITVAVFIMFVASSIITNLENFEKISTLRHLISYKSTTDEALAKQPPEYLKAATSTMFISHSKVLTPYRRYCETIRATAYLSGLIPGFDTSKAILALQGNNFEGVEQYFSKAFEIVYKYEHTPEEYRNLKLLKVFLENAERIKKEETFIRGEYESSFGFQFGYSSKNEGLRIIP